VIQVQLFLGIILQKFILSLQLVMGEQVYSQEIQWWWWWDKTIEPAIQNITLKIRKCDRHRPLDGVFGIIYGQKETKAVFFQSLWEPQNDVTLINVLIL